MGKMLNILVDEAPVKVGLGYTIMQTCAAAGVEIPRFCYHDKLLIAGNCRICLVEIAGSKKLVASCAVHATDNLVVYSNTIRVRLARQNVLEFLLANHPLDCPICDQGGECDLQDITAVFGADRGRFYETEKRAVLNKDFGPLIRTSMNRCIHCTRCVRFISMSTGTSILGTVGRGSATEISTYVNQFISDELSGNITDLCPVGALTSKPYSFRARPWELVSIESVDTLDTLNSYVTLDVVANKISRTLPYANDALNECWLSNRARYAYDGLFVQRLSTCLLKISFYTFTNVLLRKTTHSFYVKLAWSSAVLILLEKLTNTKLTSLSAVLGDSFDLESAFAAKFFFNAIGAAITGVNRAQPMNVDFNFLYLFNTSLTKLSKLPSFCLLVGTNPRLEAPLLNLRLNKLVTAYDTPVYRIGSSTSYLAYKTRYVSNSIGAFFSIAEFKHVFCKNFYLTSFSVSPFIILGQSLVTKCGEAAVISAVFDFLARLTKVSRFVSEQVSSLLDFSAFGILNSYSSRIHLADSAVNLELSKFYGYGVRRSGSSILYSLGADVLSLTDTLNVLPTSLVPFVIYQGSHGNGLAGTAHLVLPILTYVESSMFYRNLLGVVKKSTIAVSYNFAAKTNLEIFRLLLGAFSNQNLFNFTALNFYLAVSFNRSLIVEQEHLTTSSFLGPLGLSHFYGANNRFEKAGTYYYLQTYRLFFTIPKNKITRAVSFAYYAYLLSPSVTKIANTPLSSTVLNYYGDRNLVLLGASRTMNLCSNLTLKRNFSFAHMYS